MSRKLNIDRHDFVGLINRIKKKSDFLDDLNMLFSKHEMEITVFASEDLDIAVKALHLALGDADKDEWISYYCWDLDFGRNWETGMVWDKDGNDIPLVTPDDLYDMLLQED